MSSSKYELNLGIKCTSVSVFILLHLGEEPVVPTGNGAERGPQLVRIVWPRAVDSRNHILTPWSRVPS
jgi:hypothetical protein